MKAQQYRRDMPIDFDSLDTPYWNTYEMLVMYKRVNQYREVMGKKPVRFGRIKWAEQQASGHSDYTKKFALYCAELILED